jgi:hypothetical protein
LRESDKAGSARIRSKQVRCTRLSLLFLAITHAATALAPGVAATTAIVITIVYVVVFVVCVVVETHADDGSCCCAWWWVELPSWKAVVVAEA